MQIIISDYLLQGRENAIHGEVLCGKLGVTSKREMHRLIANARKNGEVICSTSGCKGYYLPSCKEELEDFIAMMESYANSTLKAIESAKNKLTEYE